MRYMTALPLPGSTAPVNLDGMAAMIWDRVVDGVSHAATTAYLDAVAAAGSDAGMAVCSDVEVVPGFGFVRIVPAIMGPGRDPICDAGAVPGTGDAACDAGVPPAFLQGGLDQ